MGGLHEVNPLPAIATVCLEGLKSFGLQYSAVYQADVWGIRLGAKLGVVPGLNNGLAVLPCQVPVENRLVLPGFAQRGAVVEAIPQEGQRTEAPRSGEHPDEQIPYEEGAICHHNFSHEPGFRSCNA